MLARWMHYLRVYGKLQLLHLRVQLEYEADLWIGILGVLLAQLSNFTFVWALFSFLPSLAGWTLWEAALPYALLILSRGLMDLLCDGVWSVRSLVQYAGLDRMLVRPLPPALQLFAHNSQLHGLGHLVLGGYLLYRATQELGLSWDVLAVLMTAGMLLNSLLILASIYLLANSTALWDDGGDNALPTFAIHLSDAVQVPVVVYDQLIQGLLTWVVPYAFVSHYPASILLRKPIEPAWIVYVLPFTGITLAALAGLVWRRGCARYQGAGH